MADIPSDVPEWASDPPANTITTPSSTQRAEGWQALQAQVERLQITTVADATLYRATVNGTDLDYTSGGGATATSIRDGLRAAINAGAEPVTAADDGADALTLTADVAGTPFTLAVTANITATTTAENSTGRPRRQFMNWLLNLIYQWVLWLRQAVFRTSDIAPDQAFGGTAPVTGAGLVVTDGHLSASGYVDGYRVAETSAGAYTYADGTTTYWDLGRDGVFRATVSGTVTASPPSVRVYAVSTSGGNRTLVQDLRVERIRLAGADLDIEAGVRIGEGRDFDEPAAVIPYQDNTGEAYVLIAEYPSAGGGGATLRVYFTGTLATPRVVEVIGAVFTGGINPWTAEIDDPQRLDRRGGEIRSSVAVGIVATDTFADSRWSDVSLGSLVELGIRGGVVLGAGLVDGTVPWITYDGTSFTGTTYKPMQYDALAGAYVYSGADWFGLGRGVGRVHNAVWTQGVGWVRINMGLAARLEVTTSLGETRIYETTHGSASWADSVGGSSWTLRLTLGSRVVAPRVVLSPLVSGTPETDALYSDNIPKAWMRLTTDGAGGFTINSSFNIDAAGVTLGGSTPWQLAIPFLRPFADAGSFVWSASVGNVLIATEASRTAAQVVIQAFTPNSGLEFNWAASSRTIDIIFLGRH